jgi:hypothetical protein
MESAGKVVDDFRSLASNPTDWIRRNFIPEDEFKGDIPWTPMTGPLNRATLARVASAAISLKWIHTWTRSKPCGGSYTLRQY